MTGTPDVTLAVGNDKMGGRVLLLSLMVGSEVPVDKLLYRVKDRLRSQVSDMVGFEAQMT